MSQVSTSISPMSSDPLLAELQGVLAQEIPMCGQMGIRVCRRGPQGLTVRLPLELNRNHQQTAFAGSLNALCTIAGWGTVFLLLKELRREASIVIRRSSIRYHEPVTSAEIEARCHPVAEEARRYFQEMLDEKGQAKLDLAVEIVSGDRTAVSFHGSYVVAVARRSEAQSFL